jgi:hypothetical protein
MILVFCLFFLCFPMTIIDPIITAATKMKQKMKIIASSFFEHSQPTLLTHGLLVEHTVVFIYLFISILLILFISILCFYLFLFSVILSPICNEFFPCNFPRIVFVDDFKKVG